MRKFSNKQLMLNLRELGKENQMKLVVRRKEISKIRAETNEIETKKEHREDQ